VLFCRPRRLLEGKSRVVDEPDITIKRSFYWRGRSFFVELQGQALVAILKSLQGSSMHVETSYCESPDGSPAYCIGEADDMGAHHGRSDHLIIEGTCAQMLLWGIICGELGLNKPPQSSSCCILGWG